MTNTNLLKARMVELGYTQSDVAARLGKSYQSFNYKLNNSNGREFTVSEIDKVCQILRIRKEDAHLFFYHKSSQKSTMKTS